MTADGVEGLLVTRGLVKDFGGVRALDGLDLTVGRRELVCIIGPNGCGKSTLFNLVTGALPPTEGRVLFDGQDITGRPSHRIARLGISRKFQVPGIYPELSALENVRVPLLAKASAAFSGSSAHATGTPKGAASSARSSSKARQRRRRAPSPMGQSNGSRSPCCSRRGRA
jgi:ABC-type branched-subunit amino acid transport system ATPase component